MLVFLFVYTIYLIMFDFLGLFFSSFISLLIDLAGGVFCTFFYFYDLVLLSFNDLFKSKKFFLLHLNY